MLPFWTILPNLQLYQRVLKWNWTWTIKQNNNIEGQVDFIRLFRGTKEVNDVVVPRNLAWVKDQLKAEVKYKWEMEGTPEVLHS